VESNHTQLQPAETRFFVVVFLGCAFTISREKAAKIDFGEKKLVERVSESASSFGLP